MRKRYLKIFFLPLFIFILTKFILLARKQNYNAVTDSKEYNRVLDKRELIYYERQSLVQNACLSRVLNDKFNRVRRMYSSNAHNLTYCKTPKVGCTFWTNVFRFISNSTGSKRYDSPFDIPRMQTHYAPMSYQSSISSITKNNTRLLFVREPYARLWSAFVDKFVLPDFWKNGEMNRIKNRKGQEPSLCPKNITFSDFLEHVVSSRPATLNEHWSPYRYLCDPCLFRPHVIGKMETFSKDVGYILKKSGLEWILDDIKSRDHAVQEIQMLSDYNFRVAEKFKTCLDKRKFSEIMWKSFQYNGYIRLSSPFPVKTLSYWNLETFKQEALSQYRLDNITSSESKTIRSEVLKKAYSEISNDILLRVRKLYKEDFQMFGYDEHYIPMNSRMHKN